MSRVTHGYLNRLIFGEREMLMEVRKKLILGRREMWMGVEDLLVRQNVKIFLGAFVFQTTVEWKSPKKRNVITRNRSYCMRYLKR